MCTLAENLFFHPKQGPKANWGGEGCRGGCTVYRFEQAKIVVLSKASSW